MVDAVVAGGAVVSTMWPCLGYLSRRTWETAYVLGFLDRGNDECAGAVLLGKVDSQAHVDVLRLDHGGLAVFDLTVKALENSFSTEEERQHLIETVILPAYEEFSSAFTVRSKNSSSP